MKRSAAIRSAVLLAVLRVAFPVTAESSATAPLDQLRELLSERPVDEVPDEARALLDAIGRSEGEVSPAMAEALDLVVSSWQGLGLTEEEIQSNGKRAVAINEELFGPQDPRVAGSLAILAETWHWDDEYERAWSLYERALEILENAHGREAPEVADLLTDFATLSWQIGNGESRPYCERAVTIIETSRDPDHYTLAPCLSILAAHLTRDGNYQESLSLAQRRVDVLEAHHGRDHPEVARALMSLSNRTAKLGDFARTEELLLEALEITRGADMGAEPILLNIGALYTDMGDHARARDMYQQALDGWTERLPPGHRNLSFAGLNLGESLRALGDYDGARRVLDVALANREALRKDFILVGILRELGATLTDLGNLDEARPYFDRAVSILDNDLGEDPRERARTLQQIAALHLRSNDLSSAAADGEKALEAAREIYGEGNYYLVGYLLDLGDIRVLQGRPDAAGELYDEAQRIIRDVNTVLTLTELDVDLRSAHATLRRGDRLAALDAARRVSVATRRMLHESLAYLPERQALTLLDRSLEPQALLVEGLLTAKDDAAAWRDALWDWTIGNRGLILEEMASRNRTALGETPEAQRAWLRVARAREHLGTLWIAGPGYMGPERYNIVLRKATSEKDEAERDLARVSRSFSRSDDGPPTRDRLSSLLPQATALVEIVRVRTGPPFAHERPMWDVALILYPDGSSSHLDLGASGNLDTLAREWQKALSDAIVRVGQDDDGMDTVRETGGAMRAALWDPIASRLGDIKRVYLVPEGPLHSLNIAALPAAQQGRFVMETGPEILLLGTARDLPGSSEPDDASNLGRGILALGDPDFDVPRQTRIAALGSPAVAVSTFRGVAPGCSALHEGVWTPLPATAAEVRDVGDLYGEREPVTIVTGPDASEERLKRDARGKRILHLATHGYFLSDKCPAEPKVSVPNPLLRTGLVLAGANLGEPVPEGAGAEDGILTAEELAALDLRGVELAVLSACNTARGRVIEGEGVFGLQRAMAIAGVDSFVMSVWPVPDRETARWMKDFYRRIRGGTPASAAAREASLEALEILRGKKRSTHPYLWASFIATGS